MMRGYTLFEITENPTWLKAGKRVVLDRPADGLRPVIARRFPVDQVVDAPVHGVQRPGRRDRGGGPEPPADQGAAGFAHGRANPILILPVLSRSP